MTAGIDENYLKELMEKYHLGGCRYNNMPGIAVQNQNRILQKYAKVPVFIAETPLTCVVEGTGILLENIHLLEK